VCKDLTEPALLRAGQHSQNTTSFIKRRNKDMNNQRTWAWLIQVSAETIWL
jgi:hypothetical protein